MGTIQEWSALSSKVLWSNTTQNSPCKATYLPSHKPFEYDKKTREVLLEIWFSLFVYKTWTCQCWPSSKDLHQLCADTRCNLGDISGVIDNRDGWQERVRKLFCRCNWMMMMIIIIMIRRRIYSRVITYFLLNIMSYFVIPIFIFYRCQE